MSPAVAVRSASTSQAITMASRCRSTGSGYAWTMACRTLSATGFSNDSTGTPISGTSAGEGFFAHESGLSSPRARMGKRCAASSAALILPVAEQDVARGVGDERLAAICQHLDAALDRRAGGDLVEPALEVWKVGPGYALV